MGLIKIHNFDKSLFNETLTTIFSINNKNLNLSIFSINNEIIHSIDVFHS